MHVFSSVVVLSSPQAGPPPSKWSSHIVALQIEVRGWRLAVSWPWHTCSFVSIRRRSLGALLPHDSYRRDFRRQNATVFPILHGVQRSKAWEVRCMSCKSSTIHTYLVQAPIAPVLTAPRFPLSLDFVRRAAAPQRYDALFAGLNPCHPEL